MPQQYEIDRGVQRKIPREWELRRPKARFEQTYAAALDLNTSWFSLRGDGIESLATVPLWFTEVRPEHGWLT